MSINKLGTLFFITAALSFAQAQNPARAQAAAPPTLTSHWPRKWWRRPTTALKANAKVGIAVVDANGDLVLSERIDGASARGVASSQGKARAALLFGLPTKEVKDSIDAGKPVSAIITIPVADPNGLVINQGGLPILKDGKVVGGIGVGGSASSEDERFAQAGLDAAFPGKSVVSESR